LLIPPPTITQSSGTVSQELSDWKLIVSSYGFGKSGGLSMLHLSGDKLLAQVLSIDAELSCNSLDR
jgi:hypothetical protein